MSYQALQVVGCSITSGSFPVVVEELCKLSTAILSQQNMTKWRVTRQLCLKRLLIGPFESILYKVKWVDMKKKDNLSEQELLLEYLVNECCLGNEYTNAF